MATSGERALTIALSVSSDTSQYLFIGAGEAFSFFLKYGLAYVRQVNESTGEAEIQKHVMRYPQYFAAKAIEDRLNKGERRGVIWHTQGSGKTALAYFSTRILADYYYKKGAVPKFYFIVDRIDLAKQAQQEFEKQCLQIFFHQQFFYDLLNL